MTRPRTRRRPAEETREILIAASRRLMATTPTSAITIRAIGTEAGVQFSLVNRHFGSKDALLRAAIEQIISNWIVAMFDGPPDMLIDRAVDYLASHPLDVAGIRLVTVDESTFHDGRSPVVDAIVDYFALAERRVEAVDVSAALSLILGWMSAEDHWVTTSEIPVGRARDIMKAHAWRCLEPSDARAPRGSGPDGHRERRKDSKSGKNRGTRGQFA